jgi:hypothetical protein
MTIIATARVDSRDAHFAQDIHARTHALVADEPEIAGKTPVTKTVMHGSAISTTIEGGGP